MQRSVEKALAASAAAGPDTSPGTIWLGGCMTFFFFFSSSLKMRKASTSYRGTVDLIPLHFVFRSRPLQTAGHALEKRRLASYLEILVQETSLLCQYYTDQGLLVNQGDAATLQQSLSALQRTSRHQQRLSASAMEADRVSGGSGSPAGV